MKVTFTRTGERRYRIDVEGKGVVRSFMEPAAGYDERLPHDLAHFIVEKYLGLQGAVYGRLAAGGHQFQPLDGKPLTGKKGLDKINADQRREADMVERIIDVAQHHAWIGRPYIGPPVKGLTQANITALCQEFDRGSAIWSKLPVGGSMSLEW
jgi:hypothetical protein